MKDFLSKKNLHQGLGHTCEYLCEDNPILAILGGMAETFFCPKLGCEQVVRVLV